MYDREGNVSGSQVKIPNIASAVAQAFASRIGAGDSLEEALGFIRGGVQEAAEAQRSMSAGIAGAVGKAAGELSTEAMQTVEAIRARFAEGLQELQGSGSSGIKFAAPERDSGGPERAN